MVNKEVFEKRQINENSINILANASNNRDKLLFLIFNSTACKTKEIIQLKLKDIAQFEIKIKERIIPISKELYNDIINYSNYKGLSTDSYLFSSRQNDQITPKRVRQIVQKYSKEILGFKINPKDMRKSSIKQKIKVENVENVKKQVGLKRFDKRISLSSKDIIKLEENISDERTKIIFSLLLNGLKSLRLTRLKVNEIDSLKLDSLTKSKIIEYQKINNLSENDPLFLTRQKSSLTKERIFQIISNLKNKTNILVTPRILNNTNLAIALAANDKSKLNALGLRTHSFHLHGGFENEI